MLPTPVHVTGLLIRPELTLSAVEDPTRKLRVLRWALNAAVECQTQQLALVDLAVRNRPLALAETVPRSARLMDNRVLLSLMINYIDEQSEPVVPALPAAALLVSALSSLVELDMRVPQ